MYPGTISRAQLELEDCSIYLYRSATHQYLYLNKIPKSGPGYNPLYLYTLAKGVSILEIHLPLLRKPAPAGKR